MCTRFIRLALVFFLAITSFSPAQAAPWQEKVSPQVLQALGQGETDFLVVLVEQADLSAAASLPTKQARGEYVYHTLTELAARTQPSLLAEMRRAGATYQAYWIANLIWVRGNAALVRNLASRSDVRFIAANPSVHLSLPEQAQALLPDQSNGLEWNIAKVNADDVWAAGFNGQGVVVAGQDTGYDWDHPALINQYRGWNGSAANHDYNWHDAIHVTGSSCGADSPVPCDDYGHGTHTMGTMVGDDGGGNQIGMAPGAKWVGCRNMNSGYGTPQTYIECFQWFDAPTKMDGSSPRPDLAPDVINNSWGCPLSEGCDAAAISAMQTVVENVRAAGIMVVASAGNAGTLGCGSVNDPPGIYDATFSVGATDSSDVIAGFSSRGPADTTNLPKPDISAPGVGIRSAYLGGGYTGMQGTSMASPHVVGLVALLISAQPSLRGDVNALENLIRLSALPRTTTQSCGGVSGSNIPNNTYGWGRIDAWAAVQSVLPPALAVAKQAPATVPPGQPITYTLTVTNTGFSLAHGAVLTDVLPQHTSFVTATLPYTLSANTVTWGLGNLSVGVAQAVKLVVQPDPDLSGQVINFLYGARSLEVTQTVSGPPVITRVLDAMSLTKQAPDQADRGSLLTYTLAVANIRPNAPMQSFVLTDTLPANTVFVTATLPYTRSGNVIEWDFSALAAGQVQTVTLTVQTPITFTGVITNSVYGLRMLDYSTVIVGLPVTTWVTWRYFVPVALKP